MRGTPHDIIWSISLCEGSSARRLGVETSLEFGDALLGSSRSILCGGRSILGRERASVGGIRASVGLICASVSSICAGAGGICASVGGFRARGFGRCRGFGCICTRHYVADGSACIGEGLLKLSAMFLEGGYFMVEALHCFFVFLMQLVCPLSDLYELRAHGCGQCVVLTAQRCHGKRVGVPLQLQLALVFGLRLLARVMILVTVLVLTLVVLLVPTLVVDVVLVLLLLLFFSLFFVLVIVLLLNLVLPLWLI